MQSATFRIDLGGDAKRYVRILGKQRKYERSSVEIKADGDTLAIQVRASDNQALFASISSALKQLRVVSSVEDRIGKAQKKVKKDSEQEL